MPYKQVIINFNISGKILKMLKTYKNPYFQMRKYSQFQGFETDKL